jgi:hypothetical protein
VTVTPDKTVILHKLNNWLIYIDDAKLARVPQLLGDHFVPRAMGPCSATPEEMKEFQAAFPEAEVRQYERP